MRHDVAIGHQVVKPRDRERRIAEVSGCGGRTARFGLRVDAKHDVGELKNVAFLERSPLKHGERVAVDERAVGTA